MKTFKEGQHRAAYAYYHGIKVADFPKDVHGRVFEVHHINGDHADNAKCNLRLVSIQEHYDIHYSQGDYISCQSISKRMSISPEEHSRRCSALQKKLIEEGRHPSTLRAKAGTHNFQTNNPNIHRIANGTHNFLTNHPNKNGESIRKAIANGNCNFVNDSPARKKYVSSLDGRETNTTGVTKLNRKYPEYVGTWTRI